MLIATQSGRPAQAPAARSSPSAPGGRRSRGSSASSIRGLRRSSGWSAWLLPVLDHRLGMAFTGPFLLLLGLLLALPIPLTNYLFGGIILLFALVGPGAR